MATARGERSAFRRTSFGNVSSSGSITPVPFARGCQVAKSVTKQVMTVKEFTIMTDTYAVLYRAGDEVPVGRPRTSGRVSRAEPLDVLARGPTAAHPDRWHAARSRVAVRRRRDHQPRRCPPGGVVHPVGRDGRGRPRGGRGR